jgi:hypothetical protein
MCELSDEQVYDLICKFSKAQMDKSKIVSNVYDYMDVAHDTFVRYLRRKWDIKHPSSYLWSAVNSTIKNKYTYDKIRSYKERPQLTGGYSSDYADTIILEDEEYWNHMFLCDGPDKTIENMSTINEILDFAERSKYISKDIILSLAEGNSISYLIKHTKRSRETLRREIDKIRMLFK